MNYNTPISKYTELVKSDTGCPIGVKNPETGKTLLYGSPEYRQTSWLSNLQKISFSVWIPVDVLLPLEDEPLMIYIHDPENGVSYAGKAYFSNGVFFHQQKGKCDECSDKVTHWIPMPSMI